MLKQWALFEARLPPDVETCQSVSFVETTVAKSGLARACLSLKLLLQKLKIWAETKQRKGKEGQRQKPKD